MNRIDQILAGADVSRQQNESYDLDTPITTEADRLRSENMNWAANTKLAPTAPINTTPSKTQEKLDNLQYKRDTLLGMEDADSFKLSNTGTVREKLIDAVELQHGDHPYDMYGGTGKYQKSTGSMDRQRELTASVLNEKLGTSLTPDTVTPQDMVDVGNWQQIQKAAALGGSPDWEAPLIRGVEQTNLTGRYKDEHGNDVNIPLDMEVGVALTGKKGDKGRNLGLMSDAEGRAVTLDQAQDPRLNASHKYLSKNLAELGLNTTAPVDTDAYDYDNRIGEDVDIAQSAGVQLGAEALGMIEKIADSTGLNALMDKANKLIGNDEPAGWTKDKDGDQTVPLTGMKVKDLIDPEKGQALADSWAGVKKSTRREFTKEMTNAQDDWDKGNYLKAMYTSATQLDRLLAQSTPEMAAMMAGPYGSGVGLVAATRASKQADEYKRNNDGKEFTPQQYAESFLTNVALLVPEKLLIKTGINDVFKVGKDAAKGIYGRATSVLKTGAGEAAQEYGESVQETYATQKDGDKTLGEIATSSEAGFSAATGGLMGSAMKLTGEVSGAVLSPVNEKVKEISDKRKIDKYAEGAGDNFTEEAATKFEEANGYTIDEAVFADGKGDVLIKRRNTMAKEIDTLSETLGTYDPESKEYADAEGRIKTLQKQVDRINAAEAKAKATKTEDILNTTEESTPENVEPLVESEGEPNLETTPEEQTETIDPVAAYEELQSIDVENADADTQARATELEHQVDDNLGTVSAKVLDLAKEIETLSEVEGNEEAIAAMTAEKGALQGILRNRMEVMKERTIDEMVETQVTEGTVENTPEQRAVAREAAKEQLSRFSAPMQEKIARSNLSLVSSKVSEKQLKDKKGKKNTLQDVGQVTDDVMSAMATGRLTNDQMKSIIKGATSSTMQERQMNHLSKGAPVQAKLEKTLDAVKAKISSGEAAEAVANLQKFTSEEVTPERLMRAMAIAVSNVYKSTQSEEDIQAAKGVYGQAGDYTRTSNIVTQIGKEYINSYGMTISGSPKDTNAMYAEIGQDILDAAESMGMVSTEKASIPLIDMVDEKGNNISSKNQNALNVTNKDGVNYVEETIARVNDTAETTSEESLGKAMDVMMRTLRPNNYEVPRAVGDAVVYVPTDRTVSDEHLNIIKDMNKLEFQLKPAFLKTLKDLKQLHKNSGMSMDQFLRTSPVAKALIGVTSTDSMLTKTSEAGKTISRMKALTDVMDNLELLEGKFTYNYESAINTRIHVMQTVLEFQGDKYMARSAVTGGTYTIDPSTEAGKADLHVLKEAIADDLGLKGEDGNPDASAITERLNDPRLKKVRRWVARHEANGKIGVVDMEKMAKDLGINSPWKALAIVKALSEVRKPRDGKIKSDYMVEFDMTASGVTNTLLNLIGDEGVSDIVNVLKDGSMDPYKYLNTILDKKKDEKYRTLKKRMKEINKDFNIDSRDMAKYVIMTWFYGSSDKNVAKAMSHDLAVDIVMEGITKYNQKSIDTVNEVLGTKKYVIDMPKAGQLKIAEITPADMLKLEKHLNEEVAKDYVSLLPGAFPQVVAYRKSMGGIYKHLEDLGWDGTMGTAMSAVLGDGTKYKMSTKKMKAMLHMMADEDGNVEVNGKHIPINEMMLNETSIKVNPQHAADAAQLLMTMKYLMEMHPDDMSGILTVHDAIYTSPSKAIEAKRRFEELLKEVALKYDFRDVALKELEALQKESKDPNPVIDEFIKSARAEVDKSMANKEDILGDPKFETNLFGSKTIGTVASKAAPIVEPSTAAETGSGDPITDVYEAVKNPKGKSISNAISKLPVSKKYRGLQKKVADALNGGVSVNMSDEFAGGYGTVMMGPRDLLKDIRTGKESIADALVKVMAHEVDHAYTFEYAKNEMRKGNDKANEVKYLEKVLDRVREVYMSPKSPILEGPIRERIEYVISAGHRTAVDADYDAHAISELMSVMRNEPDVAEAITSMLSPTVKARLWKMIERVMGYVKGMVEKMSPEARKAAVTGDTAVTMPNTLLAMEILDVQAKLEKSNTEATPKSKYGTMTELEAEFTKDELATIRNCK